jgi:D-sedoheptulose 7-phosphate isomerase
MSAETALADLYPHLGTARSDPDTLDAALRESIRQKAQHSAEVKLAFFSEHAELVVQAARTIADTYRRGGRLFTMGNGGSSCDAAHIAVEFQHPVTAGRPALAAMNLSQDMAMLTAVGNDIGFGHVYVRQVLAHVGAGDCLIGVSTSGNSENLLAAFRVAKERGAATVALAGGTGGRMRECADVDLCLVVATDSIHRTQETHVALYHILWDLTHTLLADDRWPPSSRGRR